MNDHYKRDFSRDEGKEAGSCFPGLERARTHLSRKDEQSGRLVLARCKDMAIGRGRGLFLPACRMKQQTDSGGQSEWARKRPRSETWGAKCVQVGFVCLKSCGLAPPSCGFFFGLKPRSRRSFGAFRRGERFGFSDPGAWHRTPEPVPVGSIPSGGFTWFSKRICVDEVLEGSRLKPFVGIFPDGISSQGF